MRVATYSVSLIRGVDLHAIARAVSSAATVSDFSRRDRHRQRHYAGRGADRRGDQLHAARGAHHVRKRNTARAAATALLISSFAAAAGPPPAPAPPRDATPRYELRADHDPNGIGKLYFGREIARVTGAAGISWLDRPEREETEPRDQVIEALGL